MAQIVYPEFIERCLAGAAPDLTNHVEALLLMTNNNAADSPNIDTTASGVTLDAHPNGALDVYFKVVKEGSARRSVLQPVESDGTTNVTEWLFPSLSAGTRYLKGVMIRCKSTHPTDALVPIAYRDFTTVAQPDGHDYPISAPTILLTSGS